MPSTRHQLTQSYHNSQRETTPTEDAIIDCLYILQWDQFDAEMDAMERGYQGRTGTVNDLRCEGFSEKDLKSLNTLKTEEYLTEKLEALVKSGKILKYSGYLSDFETVVEKYIPVELYEKDYFYFDHLYEERFPEDSDPDDEARDRAGEISDSDILLHEEIGIAEAEWRHQQQLKEREDSYDSDPHDEIDYEYEAGEISDDAILLHELLGIAHLEYLHRLKERETP